MTELLSRLSRTPRAAGRPGRVAGSRHRPVAAPPTTTRSLTAAGVAAAARSAGLGILAVMVVVLVAWASAADSGADAGDAVATALMAWLVGHHAHLAVPGGELALVPLGLTALPVALLHAATLRAGRAAGVRGRSAVLALASSTTATYAVLATFVALLARTDEVQALPISAFVGAAGVAALGSGTGAIRATGTWSGVSRRLHPLVRAALPAATGALAVLLGGGALVTGAALAVHRDRAALLVDGLGAGLGGGVLLGVLCVLYVPTAAFWGTAYVVGPGFAVGAGTTVSPFGVDLGAVPAVPLLAALPQEPGPGWSPLVLLVPVGAGVLAGVLAHRSGAVAAEGWRPSAEVAAVTGGLVAAAVAVLAILASGPGGPGRLAETGPDWWAVAPVAGLEVAAVMAAALLVLRRWA
jgi:hypothetical protein